MTFVPHTSKTRSDTVSIAKKNQKIPLNIHVWNVSEKFENNGQMDRNGFFRQNSVVCECPDAHALPSW